MRLFLLITLLLISGCSSTQQTKDVSIPKESKPGWGSTESHIYFNTGKPNHDFDNSPVGKLWNWGTNIMKVSDDDTD